MAADDVIAANEAFYAAFNDRDLAAMDTLWAKESAVSCIHPGWMLLEGREDVVASWEAILGNAGQPRIVAGGAAARMFGDTAIVVCREFVAGSALVATNVFVLEHGRWRMLHHHSGPVATVAV